MDEKFHLHSWNILQHNFVYLCCLIAPFQELLKLALAGTSQRSQKQTQGKTKPTATETRAAEDLSPSSF
jgi:hypothetical protein